MGSINFNPQINQKEQWLSKFSGLTVMQPKVAPVSNSNEYNISIPQNHSYTTDGNGNKIAMGQDGVGLAHRNPEEFGFMSIG